MARFFRVVGGEGRAPRAVCLVDRDFRLVFSRLKGRRRVGAGEPGAVPRESYDCRGARNVRRGGNVEQKVAVLRRPRDHGGSGARLDGEAPQLRGASLPVRAAVAAELKRLSTIVRFNL